MRGREERASEESDGEGGGRDRPREREDQRRGREDACRGTGRRRRRQQAGHRRVPVQGADDRRLPGPGLRGRVQRGPHPRHARQRGRDPGQVPGRAVGQARRRRRPRLRAAVRRGQRQAPAGVEAEEPAQGRRRAAAGHRRGPGGRGHRLAPGPGAQAQGADAADGLPRDHPGGDRPRRREPARRRPGLVDAYQARRVLDRLYGYEVSPVLWKKVMPKLSAGRVQSVATRLIVDRERERIAFRPAAYSDLEAEFATRDHGKPDTAEPTSFAASLVSVDGRRVAQGRDFTAAGELRGRDVLHLDAAAAAALAERLQQASFAVSSVERKPYRRAPYAPFRTTTLQQEASRKLGFSAKHTMSVAQRLYENGYITYMRTDSVTLSRTAIDAARRQASELYGSDYVPDAPRVYASKVKNAQEAHEAIRPAGDSFRTPAQVARDGLSADERRLYELIWQRTVASQMKDATGESVSVRVAGTSSAGERAEFGATCKVIGFYGFLKAYVEGADDPAADLDDRERRLPPLAERDPLDVLRLAPAEHATRPPARYTEASLVKELEDREIGRPSTYATIIG